MCVCVDYGNIWQKIYKKIHTHERSMVCILSRHALSSICDSNYYLTRTPRYQVYRSINYTSSLIFGVFSRKFPTYNPVEPCFHDRLSWYRRISIISRASNDRSFLICKLSLKSSLYALSYFKENKNIINTKLKWQEDISNITWHKIRNVDACLP